MARTDGQVRPDTDRADAVWAEYQRTNDTTALTGQAVGIDPDTGEVFFGPSLLAISRELEAAGCFRPLVYRRVGAEVYARQRPRRRKI